MLYRVAGDPKIGYDLGVGTGTYGGYARWVRTPVPYPRTVPPIPYPRTVPSYRTRTQKHVPASRTVPKPPRYVHRTPP